MNTKFFHNTLSVFFLLTMVASLVVAGVPTQVVAASAHPQLEAVAAPKNPVPSAASLSPNKTAAGSASMYLFVYGTHFINASKVRWNGVELATTYYSATLVFATVPAARLAAPGSASVTVFNPAPGGGTSNTLTFTITQ